QSEGGTPGELTTAERRAGRGVVVLAESRRADELEGQVPQRRRLCRKPQPFEAADEEPVDVDPDGPTPVAGFVEVRARLRHRGDRPRRLRGRAVAGRRPE